MTKLLVIGTGYVGLVSGVCLAEDGHNVTCIDKDYAKIEKLKKSISPIYEVGIEQLLSKNIERNRLSFFVDLKEKLSEAEAIIIAVGTPSEGEEGDVNLSYIKAVLDEIAENLTDDKFIIIKSTVPIGTNRWAQEYLRQKLPDFKIEVISNPEFLREGNAIYDFMHPDRVVVGAESDESRRLMSQIYEKYQDKLYYTDLESSETIKYASNSFLATKIAFINQVADLCEKTGANINDVSKAMGLDPRIGELFLNSGPGFGGSCFPKDLRAMRQMGRKFSAPQEIIEKVIDVNNQRFVKMANRIEEIAKFYNAKKLAIWGLSFKAGTDDLRESPAIEIINELKAKDYHLNLHDYKALDNARIQLKTGNLSYFENPLDAVQGADLLLVLTEWKDYNEVDFDKLSNVLNNKVIIDLRNIIDIDKAFLNDLKVYAVGKKAIELETTIEDSL